ncbi:MAG: TIM barrel protein [Candidatus Pacearchaeota archaeon]|nr:TIM barrel protein [Candidatus Pacearchaeota archaeon]
MKIRFGPAGIGGFKEAIKNLEYFSKQGIKAAEIPFTYHVWMNNEQARIIGEKAKKFDVSLSVHAHYWINLLSKEKRKQEASIDRILQCCERANYLKAKYVVFHCGFYENKTEEEAYEIVKEKIIEMQETITQKSWQLVLAPETTGKITQFGSLQELLKLMKETKCFLTIDFSHIEAREGRKNYEEIFKKIKEEKLKNLHCHFSGIEYTSKGEKRHTTTKEKDWRELLLMFKKYKLNASIINESPTPLEDSIKGIKIWKNLTKKK